MSPELAPLNGIILHRLSAAEVRDLAAQMVRVYRAAFSPPPYAKGAREIATFAGWLSKHAEQPGFHCVAAFAGRGERLCGFVYGRESCPGHAFYDLLFPSLHETGSEQWLVDSFQLTEMAVDPAYQGRGIGGRLHDWLVQGLPYPRAVLATMAAPTVAAALYTRRGWQLLVPHLIAPGLTRPYQILGLDLVARRSAKVVPPGR